MGSSLQKDQFFTQDFSSQMCSVTFLNVKDRKSTKKYLHSHPSLPASPRVILVDLWLMSEEINWKHLMCLTCRGLGLYSLRVRDLPCFINSEDVGAWISALQPDDLLNSTLTPAIAATFHFIINRWKTWSDGSEGRIRRSCGRNTFNLI